MDDVWAVLEQAGVPSGAVRRRPSAPTDLVALRDAIARLGRQPALVPPESTEPMLAWLRALLLHWPSRFREIAGPEGERLIAALEARLVNPNRYLKLRRIAIENLAELV